MRRLVICTAMALLFASNANVLAGSEETVVGGSQVRSKSPDSYVTIDKIVPHAPQAYVDYDADGLLDLVRIEVNGKTYVYINSGTKENSFYTKGIIYKGDQSIVEQLKQAKEKQETTPQKSSTKASSESITKNYERFDVVYLDSSYYTSNQADLDDYFTNVFGPRFDLLEQTTQWTSETSFNQKLTIKVHATNHPSCPGGVFQYSLVEELEHYVDLRLPDPLYPTDPNLCKNPLWDGETFQFNNPGELGDYWWSYGSLLIHESTHAINPDPLMKRSWLREGFARYHECNILSNYEGIPGITDINQETADHHIYWGSNYYNWDGFAHGGFGYITNDYHDTSLDHDDRYTVGSCDLTTPPLEGCDSGYVCSKAYEAGIGWVPYCIKIDGWPIQNSLGYNITAWMFSMLRDDYSLDWNKFYSHMSHNLETLYESYIDYYDIPNRNYQTDMVVIDLFGRALNMSFEEIKTILQYDGPSGPGWGVRQWVSRDWYADLTPTLGFSNPWPVPGEEIDLIANIYNNGQTDANDVPVAFYNGAVLIDTQRVSVPADSVAYAITTFSAPEGSYTITVKVDEDNIKMETDETNNDVSSAISFVSCCTGTMGNVDCEGIIDIGDVTSMIQNLFITLNDPCCEAEADIDQSGLVDIGDLTALISSLFITLNPLDACP